MKKGKLIDINSKFSWTVSPETTQDYTEYLTDFGGEKQWSAQIDDMSSEGLEWSVLVSGPNGFLFESPEYIVSLDEAIRVAEQVYSDKAS